MLDNGGDPLSVSANGSFTFATPLAAGSSYAVTIQTQPAGENCTLASPSGQISAAVTNITLTCSSAVPLMAVAGSGGSAEAIGIYGLSTSFSGGSPTPNATINAQYPVLGAVLDQAGNLYYLGNSNPGSSATLYTCTASSSYQACAAASGVIAGSVTAMAIDSSANLYVATVQGSLGQVIKFPAGAGPAQASVVYQSTSGFPSLLGIAITADSTILYVIEGSGPVVEGFGPAGVLYECSTSCQAAAGAGTSQQSDITAALNAPAPLSGALAVGATGELYVGLVNPDGDNAAPGTMTIAAACSGSGGTYTCIADDATFPQVQGGANPFSQTLAVAADSAGNQYVSISLDGNGTPVDQLGPQFFEFTATGTQASCGGAATCAINQVPAATAIAIIP